MLTEAKQTKDYNISAFEMHYYLDAKVRTNNYTLYNDDGTTQNSFEKGMYEQLIFDAKNIENTLAITIERKTGKKHNKMDENLITFVIHNLDKKPKKVLVNGEKHPDKVEFDALKKTATFTTNLRNYTKKIEISY
jgi:hypothetical protein